MSQILIKYPLSDWDQEAWQIQASVQDMPLHLWIMTFQNTWQSSWLSEARFQSATYQEDSQGFSTP